MMIGGAEEIGANSTYLHCDGTGILVDAGLHPRERSERTFPRIEMLSELDLDAVFITHAHTDHMGALPYVLHAFPYARSFMTSATRDISHIMLPNSAKHIRQELQGVVPSNWLEFYDRSVIEQLRTTFEAIPYNEEVTFRGYRGQSDVAAKFTWAGHILGSAMVQFTVGGRTILHSGDFQTENQQVVPGAILPLHHVDVLITEATNAGDLNPPTIAEETQRLAAFINQITIENGSVLIPCFALGKLQETILLLYRLMQRGSIPHLPMYTAGMGTRISKIYDQYCYSDPMLRPGFEISDIQQERVFRDELATGRYMKAPSIVLASAGMVNVGSISYELANLWLSKPNFGIAFVGFQHQSTPGYQLLHAPYKEPFELAGRRRQRVCKIERFRFSSHAPREGILRLVENTTPNTVVIIHGDSESCDALGLAVRERYPQTRVIIPTEGKQYTLFS